MGTEPVEQVDVVNNLINESSVNISYKNSSSLQTSLETFFKIGGATSNTKHDLEVGVKNKRSREDPGGSEVASTRKKSMRTGSDGVSRSAGRACVKKVLQEGRESTTVAGPSVGMCPINRFDEQAVLSSNRLSAGVAARREVGAQCRNLPSLQEASHGKEQR